MKNKILIASALLALLLIVLNYTFPINLSNKVPRYSYDRVEIHELERNTNYTITDKNRVKDIYDYILNRKARKMPKWFYTGLSFEKEVYMIVFSDSSGNALYIDLLDNTYIRIKNHDYSLKENDLDLKRFEEMIR